jgi:hypothetical protein
MVGAITLAVGVGLISFGLGTIFGRRSEAFYWIKKADSRNRIPAYHAGKYYYVFTESDYLKKNLSRLK